MEISNAIGKIFRFTKVEHTLFSLPLLFAGAWLAGKDVRLIRTLVLIAVAGLGARIFGMAMNRILDRDLDAMNARTADRDLASGEMSLGFAKGIAVAGLGIYLIACAALSPLCLKLSIIPVVPLFLYSWLKRFTIFCHFGIGLCLALAPLGAFVAASGTLDFNTEVWLLAFFAFFWISGFDIIYAILDIESDRETGVHSIPAGIGSKRAQTVAAFVHIPAIALLMMLYQYTGGGIMSTLSLVIAIVFFGLGHWKRIPIAKRFFPISVIAGIAGSMIVLFGEI